VLLLLASLFTGSALAAVTAAPVSAPEPAPAAWGRTQPNIAFSVDRYLAIWNDSRDCDQYESTVYGARLDRDGRVLDPKGFVIVPCGQTTGYGAPQVFAEPDGWSVTVPMQASLSVIHISRDATLGAVHSVEIPVLFDPIVTRSERGWFIHNLLGDTSAVITDEAFHPLARLALDRFGVAVVDATDGSDYISIRSIIDRTANVRLLRADVIGGDGTVKRRDVTLHTFPASVQPVAISAVWTGGEYFVAWLETDGFPTTAPRRIVAMRVSRNGDLFEAPHVIATELSSQTTAINTLQLRRQLTLVTWVTSDSSFAMIAGCEAAPMQLPPHLSFVTDGTSLLRIRSEVRMADANDVRRIDLYSSTAPIGCAPLQWSSEQLVSGATVAQEQPAVAGDAIVWIENQHDLLRGVRLDASGRIAGALRFPPHLSPRDVLIATDGAHYFVAWTDGATLKAGRVVDETSDERPEANVIAPVITYVRSFTVTWSGSEFLVIYAGSGGELRVARFTPEGERIALANAGVRHRNVRFGGAAGELLVPRATEPFAYGGAMVPRVAWSGTEGLLVWQIGQPCGIIPECFPPQPRMVRIDLHGRALDAPRDVQSRTYGASPDVIWTGTEYLVAFQGNTITARRFARDGQPLDATAIETGIEPAQFSLAMLGSRPFVVTAKHESIDGWMLDSQLRPQPVPIASTPGSGRTYAAAATRNCEVIVAFHWSIKGDVFGGSTRVFYSVIPPR
jgi:hypothetical protein